MLFSEIIPSIALHLTSVKFSLTESLIAYWLSDKMSSNCLLENVERALKILRRVVQLECGDDAREFHPFLNRVMREHIFTR